MKLWVLVFAIAVSTGQARAFELLANGDLEASDSKGGIAHWKGLTVYGAPAKFGIDAIEKHSGGRSFKIVGTESTQTYLRSEPMIVAPGEEVTLSGWVKTEKIGGGENHKVLLMAEFTNGDGRTEQFEQVVAKIDKSGTSDWMKMEGKVKVPEPASVLRIRAGMFDATGTCWWDDISVMATVGLAARFDLERPRLTPEMGAVAVMIVNRSGQKGSVRLRVGLDKQVVEEDDRLSGEAAQRISVPIKIAERGEELPLKLSLMDSGKKEAIWKEERMVEVPWAMVLSPPIPTHWAVEDGEAKIAGDVDIAVTKEQRQHGILDVVLLDKSKKQVARWETEAMKDGFNHFEMNAPKLPLGDYTMRAELKPKKGDVIAVEQPFGVINRSAARVTLNKDGYLEADGKAVFPLGIFNGGGKMKEMGEAGFTVSHTYNDADAGPGERPGDQRAMHFFSESQKAGLKAVFLVPRGLAFAHDWEGVRRRVRMFRNHPALLTWDEEEGIARDDMSPEDLMTLRKLIAEEDPNHPFMVGDSRLPITQVKDRSNFFPLKEMDLGMWWWYPIPMAAQKDAGLEGEEMSKALEMRPPSFLGQRNTDKPIWVGVQSYKKSEKSRYPNPTEYRAQAYLSVIHGAKGLMWYAGSVEGGLYLAPEEGHWDYLKKLARELNGMSDVFMAPAGESPKFTPAGALMSVALKMAEHRTVLLTANRAAHGSDVTFSLGKPTSGSIAVLGENRFVDCVGGQITDHFEAYGVHVYELARK